MPSPPIFISMESQDQGPARHPQDLKVTLQRFSHVFPLEETKRSSMFLSSIDQILNFNIEGIQFFQANHNFPPETIADKLENVFRRLLVPYNFLAGRLRMDPQKGRLEIDCNSAGAGFAVASSELSLAEIGDLVYANPNFGQLLVGKADTLVLEDQPMCVLQVTLFKCGGFSLGISVNHTLFDGISLRIFLENFASLAADKPLVVTPYNNRHLLAARSPPRVTFSDTELLEISRIQGEDSTNAKFFQATSDDNLKFKIFRLSNDAIAELKEKAKMGTEGDSKISSFNVVTAHIWRCKALSEENIGNNLEKLSTIVYTVDLRSRLQPHLPLSYTGNAVVNAYATVACRDLEEGPFSLLVQMVSQGVARMTDEYARSLIDWAELHKRFPIGDVFVSSWLKLGFGDVEYPWGRPKYISPVMHHRKDIMLLLPDMEGMIAKGVKVLVVLPSKEMEKFQGLFHKFLA